jgi:hypothetical protein
MKTWTGGVLASSLVLSLVSHNALADGHKSAGAPLEYYPGEEREFYVGNVNPGYQDFHLGSLLPEDTTRDLMALIDDFAGRWTPERWTTIPELWDRDTEPYVLLVHQREWLVGWDQVDGYFAKDQVIPVKEVPALGAKGGIEQIEAQHYEFRAEPDMEAMMYNVDRVTMHEIAPGLVSAVWYVDFQFKPRRIAPRGEHFKANAIFKETGDGWKFVHYGEAAMAPIMYIERLYRSQVSHEFLGMIEEQESEKEARTQ